MKKRDLKSLAVLGIASGIFVLNEVAAETGKDKPSTAQDANDGNLGYHLYTEDELLMELNEDGIKMYKSLDAEGKKLALTVASMRCNNTNPCKNLNACKTDQNDCAGKGACKGKSKCALADKNLAVKLVYDKMAKKRSNVNYK